MKINAEFINHSIFSENISELTNAFEINDEIPEIMHLFFIELRNRVVDIVKNIKNRKYTEARSLFGIKDMFVYYNLEVIDLRVTLKSLISGIINTSAIKEQDEITDYQKKWNYYDDSGKSNIGAMFHHHLIYHQFKKVTTLEELAEFNEQFHQYLVEMAFKLSEIIIRRMTYTIEYMKNDEVLKESCHQAAVQLELFQDEIEKLKENPLQK